MSTEQNPAPPQMPLNTYIDILARTEKIDLTQVLQNPRQWLAFKYSFWNTLSKDPQKSSITIEDIDRAFDAYENKLFHLTPEIREQAKLQAIAYGNLPDKTAASLMAQPWLLRIANSSQRTLIETELKKLTPESPDWAIQRGLEIQVDFSDIILQKPSQSSQKTPTSKPPPKKELPIVPIVGASLVGLVFVLGGIRLYVGDATEASPTPQPTQTAKPIETAAIPIVAAPTQLEKTSTPQIINADLPMPPTETPFPIRQTDATIVEPKSPAAKATLDTSKYLGKNPDPECAAIYPYAVKSTKPPIQPADQEIKPTNCETQSGEQIVRYGDVAIAVNTTIDRRLDSNNRRYIVRTVPNTNCVQEVGGILQHVECPTTEIAVK